jgi:hypothetical protein
MPNPIRGQVAGAGGSGFNPYAAGKKQYGSGRPMPTSGKVADKVGYADRDAAARARRDALMRLANGGK